MKLLKTFLIGLLFIGCGGGGSTSTPASTSTPSTETMAQTEVLNTEDTISIGEEVGKVTIPIKTDDSVEKVELIGTNSDKFLVSNDGVISTKSTLKDTSKTSNKVSEKTIRTEVTYAFQVKITYASGNIVYINVQVIVVTFTEVQDDDTTPQNQP